MNVIEEKLKIPAIILMILAILGMIFSLLSIVGNILIAAGVISQEGMVADPQMKQMMASMGSGVVGIIMGLVYIIMAGVTLFGAIKMKKGESYGLAMAAAILAIIPCYHTCCLGLPFGIWALVVLLNDEVKAAFNQNAAA